MLPQQLVLFSQPELSLPSDWRGVQCIQLSNDSWLELHSGWLKGHGLLFDQLCQNVDWQKERRVMYERLLDVPRLVASLPENGLAPPILERAAVMLSERYGRSLSRLGLCMYRGGQDSVACMVTVWVPCDQTLSSVFFPSGSPDALPSGRPVGVQALALSWVGETCWSWAVAARKTLSTVCPRSPVLCRAFRFSSGRRSLPQHWWSKGNEAGCCSLTARPVGAIVEV